MTTTEPIGNRDAASPCERILRHVRFVERADVGQEVLLEFRDPVPHKAVCVLLADKNQESTDTTGIDILTVAGQPNDPLVGNDEMLSWVASSSPASAPRPVVVSIHGAQVIWGTKRAAILAAPDRASLLLLALVDFCYYEHQLQKLEAEIAENWSFLETDSPLAYEVVALDPERFEQVGQRMEQTLKRRMRLARTAPHMIQPRLHLLPLANQLIERLGEKAHVEDRLEAINSQLDVCDRIYELNSQKIVDFKNARQDRTLTWVIIVLLAAESLLLLIDLLWMMGV